MVNLKRLSGAMASSSKKKFDKNRSFSGVESKNMSPKKRRKSIAAFTPSVLPTPIKHKGKKRISTEWTISENVNNQEVSITKEKVQQERNEESTPLPLSTKKNRKSFKLDTVLNSTPIVSTPKSIKKTKVSVLKEIDNVNTSIVSSPKSKSTPRSIKTKVSVLKEIDNVNTSILSPTIKISKDKKKSNSNAENNKSIDRSLTKKAPLVKESVSSIRNQVKLEDIENAIEGVIKFRSENPKLKNILFTDCYPLFLQISCIKMPKGHSKILRIPLPHSFFNPDDEVCLIVPEVKGIKNIEHEKHIEHYKELLHNKGITNIKKIMTCHELRTEYETFEQKSRLVDLYDFFLVDGKVSGKVVKRCGKIFYKRRKVPIPVKLQATKLKEQIEKALSKAFFYLHLKGDSYSVQFGHDQMETGKLVENVYSIIEFLDKEFPGGFTNFKGIQIYAQRATSIPIYLNFKFPTEIKVRGVKSQRPKAYKTYKDELTTLHDAEVTVKPTGEVLVERRQNKRKTDNEITDSDLIQAHDDEKKVDEEEKKKNKSRKRKQNAGDAETEIFYKMYKQK